MGDPSLEKGGEGEGETLQPAVTTRCTEVCDKGMEPKPCPKICLVKVHAKACPEKATKVFVILDDQSNRPLASSEFFNSSKSEGQTRHTLKYLGEEPQGSSQGH